MDIYRIIVGTAGHIDHGKSSLVRALTGIDPDRLAEEKERGMTIDLGFAPWKLPDGRMVGLIDVPGHERFIKNMVAGATGIDFVVLVVAADDGVMPQTREHLEIMTLLGIERGVIALTKIDLVDPDLVELAIEDVRELVRGTFLEQAEIYPLSTHSEVGLDAFKSSLAKHITSLQPQRVDGPFRMPIQRVFSASGFGTIVTGIPVSGALQLGDRVLVLPIEGAGRVRGLQAYKERVESVATGHSSAINLSDLDYRAVHRGMVLCSPGAFQAGDMFEARLRLSTGVPWPLKHLAEVRLHTGTAEVLGVVALLEGNRLEPGAETFVQLRLEESICAAPGDRFILRLASPMITLGGGVLLGRSTFRIKRSKAGVIERLMQAEVALEDRDEALLLALEAKRDVAMTASELARQLKWSEEELRSRLESNEADGKIVALGASWISAGRASSIEAELLAALLGFYQRHPHRLWMELRDLRSASRTPVALQDAVLNRLVSLGRVERRGTEVRDASRTLVLEPRLQARCDSLYSALATEPFMPPSPAEVGAAENWRAAEVAEALKTLQDLGRVRIVNPELALTQESIDRAAAEIRANIQKHGELNIPELRDALGTSRKYLIPLLDFFDRTGLTSRQGPRRILKSP